MSDLIDTTEMYLRTILELEEEGVPALRARIAERLHHSGPTVSQTIARMERDGLVRVGEDRHLEFTAEGRARAVAVMRKHRLAERLLADVIGLDWQYVHEEACRWEHVMSERVERRLMALLDAPTRSPYGNPIPGLEEIGGPPPESFAEGLITAADAAAELAPGQKRRAVIVRLAEPVQVDAQLLGQLQEFGIQPEALMEFSSEGDYVAFCTPGGKDVLELPAEIAAHLFITVEPSA